MRNERITFILFAVFCTLAAFQNCTKNLPGNYDTASQLSSSPQSVTPNLPGGGPSPMPPFATDTSATVQSFSVVPILQGADTILNATLAAGGDSMPVANVFLSIYDSNQNLISTQSQAALLAPANQARPLSFDLQSTVFPAGQYTLVLAAYSIDNSQTYMPPTTFTNWQILSPIQIAAGSSSAIATTSDGTWSADTDYSGPSVAVALPQPTTIGGTADPALYQNYRCGNNSKWQGANSFTYTVTVPSPGDYQLTLMFSEPQATSAGQRIFSVTVNGQAFLSNFDIYASAGTMNQAVVKSNIVNVSGTQIKINFSPSGGESGFPGGGTSPGPLVNAIQVMGSGQ